MRSLSTWTKTLPFAWLLGLAVCGCGIEGPSDSSADSGHATLTGRKNTSRHVGRYPFKIVTTCGMVTDIVRVIAGQRAEVVGLLGEGVDPHTYKPTRRDVKQLRDADVVFYSGLMLEGRMAQIFARLAGKGKPVYAVSEGIDPSYLRSPPGFAGHFDPHVWMDVAAWSRCVEFVARRLAEFDPNGAKDYSTNALAYREELDKLDHYAKKLIGSISRRQRVLITAHDAFGYFSRAYGISVRSVQGITTESEAGVDDINKLVDFIVDRQVKAVFVESSVSEKNTRAVLEGVEQKGWKTVVGGKLFSDAMGPPGTYEGTYIGMIDHNVTVIARALDGKAPEKGMNGKLGKTK